MPDPQSMPVVRDPVIVPEVMGLYRSFEFPDRLVYVEGVCDGVVKFTRSLKLPSHFLGIREFFDRYIHASTQEAA